MRKFENATITWCVVSAVGMFIAVGGMHKLGLWGPNAAINIILLSHMVAAIAAVHVGTRD